MKFTHFFGDNLNKILPKGITKDKPVTFIEKEMKLQGILEEKSDDMKFKILELQKMEKDILENDGPIAQINQQLVEVQKTIEDNLHYIEDNQEQYSQLMPDYQKMLQQYKIASQTYEKTLKSKETEKKSREQELEEIERQIKECERVVEFCDKMAKSIPNILDNPALLN